MNSLIYIIVPVSIIAINGPLIKSYFKSLNRQKNSKDFKLRKDNCYLSKKDNCPMSSYRQCTNNNLPKSPCDCMTENYELCPYSDNRCQNKISLGNLPVKNNIDHINYPKTYPRVNIYKSNKSSFDFLK